MLSLLYSYHDWEHFSSIRNLRGPHAGLPNIHEVPSPEAEDEAPSPPASTKKPVSKVKESKRTRPKLSSSNAASSSVTTEEAPATPTEIPLPPSRSPSPESLPYPMPSGLPRIYRSPKRTFDESSASSEGSQGAANKRPRSATRKPFADTVEVTADDDFFEDVDTPDLTVSNPGSPSSSSLSSVPSPAASPPPEPKPAPERRLTRRDRKRLGLPKGRNVNAAKVSAGKIIIPGGRFKTKQQTSTATIPSSEGTEEWQQNGTGRVDVRGFRELKI